MSPTRTREPHAVVDEPMGMRWHLGRVLAVVVGLAIVLFWAWIFSGGPKKQNPDYLEDREYAAALEARCEVLRDDIGELPLAKDADTAEERAAVIAEANVLIDAFLDDLEAGAPTTGDAATSVEGWLADWRRYLANREDFVERLAEDPDAQLLLDVSPLGDSVDKTIQVFAEDVNGIEACTTPGDVG